MSRLDKLVHTYCPDGVTHTSLENVCRITKGVQFNKTDMQLEGTYPVINGGINPSGYIEKYNNEGNVVTVSQGGASAGFVSWQSKRFWAGAHCYVVCPDKGVNKRYLFHFMKSMENKLKDCQYGAGIPAIAKTTLASLSIPVPPLPVQEEIVRILDSFTELTAELQAELQARKKQFEHYRALLFTLHNDAPKKKLIDVANISRGVRVVKKQLNPNGKYPVYQNSLAPMGYYDKSNCSPGTTYVISAGAAGEIGFCKTYFWAADDCFIFSDLKGLQNRYIYYYLCTIQDYIKSNVRKASIPRLSRTVIENIQIPIIPEKEQDKIVAILDRFDTLCNDLSSGLPAEIEARQKQYEYYRDKLLTFKPLS